MLYLSQFNSAFQSFKIKFDASNVAFIIFLSTFGLKHLLSITSAFNGIDILLIEKSFKSLGIIFLLFFFIKEFIANKVNIKSAYLFLFLIYIFIFAFKLSNYYFDESLVIFYLKHNLNALLGSISFFLIGFFLPNKLNRLYIGILVSVLLLIFLYDLQFVSLKYRGLNLYLVDDTTQRANYLFWGDSFAMLSLLSIFSTRGWQRYLLILISFVGLSLMLSRSSLLSYSIALLVGLFTIRDYKALTSMFTLGLVGAIFVVITNSKLRALSITNLNDSSLNARFEITKLGLLSIKENFITGDFLGQIRNPGEKYNKFGFYIHNYLSVWRQFGILSFLAFCFYFFQAIKSFIIKRKDSPYTGVVIYNLVSVVFFKAYLYPYFWLVAGMLLSSSSLAKTNKDN